MTGVIERCLAWWSGGDLLMPVMLAVAVALYTLLAERSIALFGARRGERMDGLSALLATAAADRAWAARCIAVAEQEELTRGSTIARALTASLPLLGLLGTVTGMVETFSGLAQGGNGAAARQAGAGIGMALTATQYGMGLAIPALVWEWVLGRRAATLAARRETALRAALAAWPGAAAQPEAAHAEAAQARRRPVEAHAS